MQKSKNGTEDVEVTPTYVTALSTFINLSILNGRATATVQINAKSADALTKAKASIQFIRSGSGNIKTYSGTMSKAGRKYTFKKTYQLPKRGNYYIKATIKCYKNGKRIETIKKTSKVVAY